MAKINLLPWRAERRKQREREFYMMLGAALVAGILAVLLWVLWMDARIQNQDGRNAYLQGEIKALDSKLEKIKDLEKTKSKLLARKQIIEQLQASRTQMVHLFDELVKTIPDGVRLDTLKQTGDTLTLEGQAQSNASVASYMRNLEVSPYLTHSDLKKTEAKESKGDKRNRFQFSLDVKVRKTENPDDAQGGDKGTAPAAPGAAPPPKPAAPASAGGAP
jgi:type IV pilus assembly protein PilN